jgi:hypothetical protein
VVLPVADAHTAVQLLQYVWACMWARHDVPSPAAAGALRVLVDWLQQLAARAPQPATIYSAILKHPAVVVSFAPDVHLLSTTALSVKVAQHVVAVVMYLKVAVIK